MSTVTFRKSLSRRAVLRGAGISLGLPLLDALRPNLKKLMEGNERVVKYSLNGWLRARREAKAESENRK